jgi:hypothetical protein
MGKPMAKAAPKMPKMATKKPMAMKAAMKKKMK